MKPRLLAASPDTPRGIIGLRLPFPGCRLLHCCLLLVMLIGLSRAGEQLSVRYEIDGVELNGPPMVYEGTSPEHRLIQVILTRTTTNAAPWEALSFRFATADPSGPDAASSGVDYTPTNGVARMSATQASARFSVQILDDGDVESFEESFNIHFTDARTESGQPVVVVDSDSDPMNSGVSSIRIHDNEVTTALDVGSRDPEPLLHFSGGSSVVRTPLRSGRSLVAGDFQAVNGQPRPGLARLLANGDLDVAFVPDPELRGANDLGGSPLIELRSGGLSWITHRFDATTGSFRAERLVVLGNDGTLLGRSSELPVTADRATLSEAANGTLVLQSLEFAFRLQFAADGALIASNHLDVSGVDFTQLVMQPDGRWLGLTTGTDDSTVRRLLPSGLVDPTFAGITNVTHTQLAVDLDGSFYVETSGWLRRHRADGTIDPAFPAVFSEARCLGGAGFVLMGNRLAGTGCRHGVNGVPIPPRLHLTRAPSTALALFAGVRRPDRPADGEGLQFWSGSIHDYDHRSRETIPAEPLQLGGEPALWATFRRLGSSTTAASLRFAVRDITGRADAGYRVASGVLHFAPLEVEKQLKIPVDPGLLPPGQHVLEVQVLEAMGFEVLPPPLTFLLNAGQPLPATFRRVRVLESGGVIVEMVATQATTVLGSSDLIQWKPLGSMDVAQGVEVFGPLVWMRPIFGTTTFLDRDAPRGSSRYYRAWSP